MRQVSPDSVSFAAIDAFDDGSFAVVGGVIGAPVIEGKSLPVPPGMSSGNAVVIEYDAMGNRIAAVFAGGSGFDEASAAAAGPFDRITVVGRFEGVASFGTNGVTRTEVQLTSAGAADAFVVQYDRDRRPIWAARGGGAGFDFAQGVVALADGKVIACGAFQDGATFTSGGTTTPALASAGQFDVFLTCFNIDGTIAWVRRAGGAGDDIPRAIGATPDGRATLTGAFTGTATFGTVPLTSAGGEDVFVVRYNPDGSVAWAKRAGGIEEDAGFGAAVGADGRATITGQIGTGAVFNPGEPGSVTLNETSGLLGTFVARYELDGSLAWARHIDATSSGRGVAYAADGDVLITGQFEGTADFIPSTTPGVSLTSALPTCFLARYDANGNARWARQATATNMVQGLGVTTTPDDGAVVVGSFLGAATFGAGEPNETSLSSFAGSDLFIAKYVPPPSITETKITAFDAAQGDQFGTSVAIRGGAILVGSPFDDDTGSDSGSVYRFARSGGAWVPQGSKLSNPNGSANRFRRRGVDVRGSHRGRGTGRGLDVVWQLLAVSRRGRDLDS